MKTAKTDNYYRAAIVALVVITSLGGIFFFLSSISAGTSGSDPTGAKWKILHIMSYHAPWKWTDHQLAGFKAALKGLDVEYRVFQMDTKRKSSNEWKQQAGRQARELIEAWKPDLVYTNDDNAQAYVVKHYVNTDTPFVFSGVNADPDSYGFVGSRNVTGVLEQEHFVQSVELLKQIVPGVKRIAVVIDDGPTWPAVIKRMKHKLHLLSDIQFVRWDLIHTFEAYQRKVKEYQTDVDAIALLGIFTFKNRNHENVPYIDVLKWTVQNSQLPDFSFWEDRIQFGTLCAVTVSGYEQGLAAGKIARGILEKGRSPASYPMKPTVKGEPIISYARAQRLGIKVKSSILLASEIQEKFAWEK